MVNTAGPPTTDNPIKAVPENVILPPPEIRNVVDKTANFVARNGIQFEEKIRENEKNNSKFYFLNPKDPYHAYYQWKLVEYKEGGAQLPLSASTAASLQQDSKVEDSMGHTGPPSQSLPTIVVTPPAPRPLEFMIDIPPMSSQDYDIIKMTAQFVAKNGRQFMNHLAQKESRNHQFDFLKPSHPLFGLFNKLVEQFTKILSPSAELTQLLWWNVNDRHQIIHRIEQRAEYIKWKESQLQKIEEEKEKERMAFASIDWHGFVVVETITIDETDFETPLPAPTTLLELQRVSLQQRQLGLLLDGGNTNVSPLEEDLAGGVKAKDTKNTFDHEPETNEKLKNSEKSISMEIDTDTEPPLNNNPLSSVGASLKPKDFMTQKPLGKGPPRLGATLPPESTLTGPIRVKKEVIPRKTKLDEPTQVCPRCGQSILISEMDEHMRIELLDPKWREQRQAYEQAKRETNLNKEGEQVVHSLKTFAEYRKDIFGGDEVDLQKKIEEDLERQRELSKKKVIWDGHTASIATATQKVKEIVPLDEQIMSIHKAKGLIEEPNVHGPTAPWVQAPSTFPNLSSYPTNSHYSMVYQNPMLHPKPPNYHHPRLETEEELEYEAKRMKIMEVLVHEDTWISQHPHTIMIHVQVPEVKEFPLCTNQWMALEFHLRQTVYQVKEQISTILDVPVHQLELGVPISSPEGTEVIFTKNQFSLAYYNLPETTNAVLKILV